MRDRIIAKLSIVLRHPLLRGWQWVLATFLVSRVVVFALIALSRVVLTRGIYWHPGGVIPSLLNFDGELWYIDIARRGYYFSAKDPSSMGFFPFYPMLIRAAWFVFPDIRLAALAVAHICLLVAALLLNALINYEYADQRINRAALMFLMFGPASFFFSHAYSESTFLLLAAGAFLAALKRRWLIACLCGMCLSATRNIGVFIAAPLVLEYARQVWKPFPQNWRALIHPRVLLFALIPAGVALFFLYSYFAFHDPFAYVKATAVWGRKFVMPWVTIANAAEHPPFFRTYWGIGLCIGLATYIAGFFLRLRASFMVYASLLVAIYLCGNSLEAIARYMSVVFPLYISAALAATRFPAAYPPMLGLCIALFVVGTMLSAVGFWIT